MIIKKSKKYGEVIVTGYCDDAAEEMCTVIFVGARGIRLGISRALEVNVDRAEKIAETHLATIRAAKDLFEETWA